MWGESRTGWSHMPEQSKPDKVYVVDFNVFHKKPRGIFDYHGKKHPAWSPRQLGQADSARIDSVGADLKASTNISEQYDVIVAAITLMVPSIPAETLRKESFEALLDAFAALISEGKPLDAVRPTKAGRKPSGSRRTTAQ